MKTTLILTMLLSVSQAAGAEDRIIAMQGTGSIKASPDLVAITFSVAEHNESDASAAKAKVDEISSNAVAALLDLGVKKEKISSSSFDVSRSNQYDDRGNVSKTYFYVSRRIEAELSGIDLYNPVIQALVDSGVSRIESVEPKVSNYDELEKRATAMAAANARENAEFLADQLGAKVGKVQQIGHRQLRRNSGYEEVISRMRGRPMKPPPPNSDTVKFEFAPGDIEVEASVYVEFELE